MARRIDCTLDLAPGELDLVVVLGADQQDATVAKEAREIFNDLGVKPFLERLNRAAGFEQVPGGGQDPCSWRHQAGPRWHAVTESKRCLSVVLAPPGGM